MNTSKKEVYCRKVNNSVDCLADKDGKLNFGTYNKAIPQINMIEARRPLGYPAFKRFEKFRLKEWEAFQAGNERLFIFGAIYNAKLSGIICLNVYDREYKKMYKINKIINSSKIKVASGLLDTETKCETKNISMHFYNNLKENEIKIIGDIRKTKVSPEINLDIKGYHTSEPIVTCQPFYKNRGLYSHKSYMTMDGYVILGEERIDFDIDNSYMIIDDHKGYYPWSLKYDWVTGWGENIEGSAFGFNLTDNQVNEQKEYNENCIWIDEKMYPLPPIVVKRDYSDKEVWNIRDEYDMVNIYFYPETKISIKFNCVLIYTDYEAPMGRFEGYFRVNDKQIYVKECFGMGEKKRYRI